MNFSLEIGPKTEVDTVPALSDVYITMLPEVTTEKLLIKQ